MSKVTKALSDELAGMFSHGFLDDRMVEDIVAVVRKHSTGLNKELVWSEIKPPQEGGRDYYLVYAKTPFGVFNIRWRDWKPKTERSVYFGGDYVLNGGDTLVGAKDLAQSWWYEKLQEAL